jgi:hypothetical protein
MVKNDIATLHERIKIQLTLAIQLYMYTGSRIGEFISDKFDSVRGIRWNACIGP